MSASGARLPVTRERIAAVALAIVDGEGTAAVTMRRVAGELGVQAPSLYGHVRDREEILQLALARATRELHPAISTGDWRADLRAQAVRMHQVLKRHGDIASVQFGAIPTQPEALEAFAATLETLSAAGLPHRWAIRAVERISLYVTADAYEQWEFARRGSLPDAASLPTEVTEVLDLWPDEPGETPDLAFEFGLDLLIDGLAARVAESG